MLFDRQGKLLGAYSVLNAKQYRELDEQIERALAAEPTEHGADATAPDASQIDAEAVSVAPNASATSVRGMSKTCSGWRQRGNRKCASNG